MIALGIMSGTSTDGVDVAAIQIDSVTHEMRFLGVHGTDFPEQLRNVLLNLQQIPAQFSADVDPFSMLLDARQALTLLYAQSAHALINTLGLNPSDISVLGAHGQTIRHRPDLGYTYQLLDGALLAANTGIDVVNDFRSKDVALNGQGAPLVPAFHQAWLNARGIDHHTAVLNLGGFSNLTVLHGLGVPLTGGDCGPANCLMNLWAQRAFHAPMDFDGQIASMGQTSPELLERLWQHPFFAQSWPKSTGRDAFNEQWFDQCLAATPPICAQDVMSTLLDLAVRAIHSSLPFHVKQVFVCGGGAQNKTLISRLQSECASVEFFSIERLGLPTQAVEAAAFAWLASQSIQMLSGNCPSVTGACRSAVLGALHRAA